MNDLAVRGTKGDEAFAPDFADLQSHSRPTGIGRLIGYSIVILAALVLAPVFEAFGAYCLYHYWGSELAEQADHGARLLSAMVPAVVCLLLLLRRKNLATVVTPWRWLRRHVFIFLASLAIFQATRLFITKDHAFGPKGQILSYYLVRSDGTLILSDHAGTDTLTGLKFSPVTPDKYDWIEAMRLGSTRVPVRVDPAKSVWFFPGGGAALFYTEHAGQLEFFDRPGRHPYTNAQLQPVTSAVRARWEQVHESQAPENKVDERFKGLNERLSRLEVQAKAAIQAQSATGSPELHANQSENEIQPVRSGDANLSSAALSIQSVKRLQPDNARTPSYARPAQQIPPLHYDCGSRHWRWARCPRYGLPRPRIGAPRHHLCGYFHWPNEFCPARDFTPLCQTFSN